MSKHTTATVNFVHPDSIVVRFGVHMRTKASFSLAQKQGFSGAWGFDQAYGIAEQIAQHVNHAWQWMVRDVKEAMVAQKVFSVVRLSERASAGHCTADDMDLLLQAVSAVLCLGEDE